MQQALLNKPSRGSGLGAMRTSDNRDLACYAGGRKPGSESQTRGLRRACGGDNMQAELDGTQPEQATSATQEQHVGNT